MLGHDLTEDSDHIHRVISYPAKIMRLWDDMGSAKVGTRPIILTQEDFNRKSFN
jgi:hypothetical protein